MNWFRRRPLNLPEVFFKHIKPLSDGDLVAMYDRIRSEVVNRQITAARLVKEIDAALQPPLPPF